MVSRVNQICGFGDHFWYPEIQKQIAELSKKPHDPDALKVDEVKVDLAKLYQKRPDTFLNDLTVFVLKILHQLKLYFSSSYRCAFNRSVEVLNDAVQSKVQLVRHRTIARYKLKKDVHRCTIERRARLKKGIELMGKLRKNIKAREKAKVLQKEQCTLYRNQLAHIYTKWEQDSPTRALLKQYQETKKCFDAFIEKQPKMFKSLRQNEKEKSNEKDYQTNLKNLSEQIKENPKIIRKTEILAASKDKNIESLSVTIQQEISDQQYSENIEFEKELNEAHNAHHNFLLTN